MKFPPLLGAALVLAAPLTRDAAGKPPPPAAVPMPVEAAKAVTSGTFRDSAGQAHPWEIDQSHALEWDGAPYLPVGGAFTPHYWADGQTDAAWAADMAALQTLKQHGVTDLSLYAGPEGLTHVPPAAVQRLLDSLDAAGFHYGLEVADFPKDPLVGYVVKPSAYRDPAPPPQGPVRFSHIVGLRDAIYLLANGSEVMDSGAAKVTADGTAEVDVKQANSGDVLLLYPRRSFAPGSPESHLPDLWQGYDEYRDRLLTFFSHIHLGKGFRFFLDPLTDRIGLNGEVQNLVPTTEGFRLEFEAWLGSRYGHNLDTLNRRWGIEDRDMPDFTTAARCIPLWFQHRGLPAIYDPVKGVQYDVFYKPTSGISSTYWDDLEAFKVESTRDDMNSIAETLKKAVADVPVLYKWSRHSPLFTNSANAGGYDGLGIEAYGRGLALARDAGAYAYAQAEETPKTTWLIVSDTADAPLADKTTPGYASKAALFGDWDELKDIGARGFFAEALQRLPEAENKNVNLAALPDQLGWLGSYAATLQASGRTLTTERPGVLWYPQDVSGPDIGVRLLGDNVWWLPTYRPGQRLDLGLSLLGYSLADPVDGQAMNVIWSPQGADTRARFDLGKAAAPLITDVAGEPIAAAHKNGVWDIPVGAAPTLVRGVQTLPLPLDAPAAAERQVWRLLALAASEKINVDEIQNRFFYAENTTHDTPQEAPIRYMSFRRLADALTLILSPYIWVEGEAASDYTFDSFVSDPEASGGVYLALDTDRDPPPAAGDSLPGYHAVYQFNVISPGTYTIWMAGTPPGTAACSPFTWQVDQGAPSPGRDAPTEGSTYAGQFAWSQLGEEPLTRGRHSLTIVVTGRRALDQRYALSIDAFCITRAPFQPDGPRRPPIEIPPHISDAADKAKTKKR